jgi:beta-lactamase superfamily II metal-dependent hydrolase
MTGTSVSTVGINVTAGNVLVRMYDIGFGDCFLLGIPTPDGPRKILVDCGSIAKRSKSITEIVKRVVEDVRDADGVPRIVVIIASHRHADHIAGFARPEWGQVEVGEVWMPWTEHPTDAEARRIREAQLGFAAALANALSLDAGIAGLGEIDEDGESPLDLTSYLTLNALSNEQAMDTLHDGFLARPRRRSRRRFLPEGGSTDTRLTTSILPGVVVHVLGPSRTEDVIRDMNPPVNQSYLQFLAVGEAGPETPEPFGQEWVPDNPVYKLSDDDEMRIQSLRFGEAEKLAVALDKAVNGTSLMLMFVIGSLHLLFPGDAQWGTWKSVLDDPVRRQLLRKTHFYKVGHHGSHNATPVEFVEEVLAEAGANRRSAMVSVRPRPQWSHIPREPLLENLASRIGAIARSDMTEEQQGFVREGDWYLEIQLPINAG